MKIALVTLTNIGVNSNIGCHFITAGIKYILEKAFDTEKIYYYHINIETKNKIEWQVIKYVDLIVICGNPRFNSSDKFVYTDNGIWNQLVCTTIPIIDAWNGSAWPFPEINSIKIAENLEAIKKTERLINYAKLCKLVVVRDEALYNLLKEKVSNLQFLHCSTWWARNYYGITPDRKNINLIIPRAMPKYEWMLKTYKVLLEKLNPCHVVCTSLNDYLWVRNNSTTLRPILINDPIELLKLYSVTDKMVSIRLHASIPAMSLDAKVCNFFQDSRFLTCSKFGVPSYSFTDLKDINFEPTFHRPTNTPDLQEIVSEFKISSWTR